MEDERDGGQVEAAAGCSLQCEAGEEYFHQPLAASKELEGDKWIGVHSVDIGRGENKTRGGCGNSDGWAVQKISFPLFFLSIAAPVVIEDEMRGTGVGGGWVPRLL